MKHCYRCVLFALLLLPAGLFAQVITGTILDETKTPLPGVAVLVVEQKTGATTEMDGKFRITGVKPGTFTLEISFIGYATVRRSVTVQPGQPVDIGTLEMVPETSVLDEVVVVGYGVQRKRDVTGSVVKLNTKDLTDIPAPSFENAIQGKAAGVQVITGSGLAGSGSVVRIRGTASISSGGDPLYVVDGIPITQDYFIGGNSGGMNNNPLATINPNDIESIEVLKDASAAGIYGSRGANGVVLITTKRGKGKLKYNFSSRLGVSVPTARPNMLNSQQYLQLFEEAWVNDGNVGTPVLPGDISWADAQRTNTDWVDETIGVGFKQRYDFSVQQGGEKLGWYAGVTYDGNDSYLLGNSYNRLSGRFNMDYQFSKKFKASLSSSLAQGTNNRVDAAWSGGLGAAMSTALPIYPVYHSSDSINPDGSYEYRAGDYFNLTNTSRNPVAQRELKVWRTRELRSINNLNLTYTPVEKLTLQVSGSYDYMLLTEDIYEPGELLGVDHRGIAKRFPRRNDNWNVYGTATYLYDLNASNKFTFMVGTEAQRQKRRDFAIPLPEGRWTNEVSDAPGPFFDNPELKDNNSFDTILPGDHFTFVSYFTRVNYSYKDKYFATAVLRADGSSKFGPENRFGFFPSLGLGWVLTEEAMLKNISWLNFLKLRSSIGVTGNANFASDQWRGTYRTSGTGYNGEPYLYPERLANPDLKWESSTIWDAALEYGILNDRITGEIAYYYKSSKDLLLNVTVQRSTGFSNYWDNLGEITNQGVEFTIRSRNLVGELQWSTDFNIAYNTNKITSIGGYSPDAVSGGTNDTRVVVGEPVGTNYLVRFSHVDSETGRPVYLDINGNPTFDWTPDDRVPVGNVMPDAIGGITNNFKYRQWDFSFLFVFTIGGDIYDSSSKRQLGVITDWNMRTDIFDRWQQPGDVAAYPRLTLDTYTYGSNTPWINTTQWLHDGSYVRLRNLTVGYTLPDKLVQRWKLASARVYFVGTNLLTFTKYPGLDPEIARDFENATDRNMSPNITYLTPPQEKTFSLGIDVSF